MHRGILKSRSTDSVKRLMRSEEKFNMLFEFSPIGMAMVDHETGDFIEVNQSLLTSTGYTKEAFLGLSYWDITPSEYEAQEVQQIQDLNTKGFFEEMLYQATHCAKRTNLGLYVIMLDIDHFKSINDQFGHLVGDAVLIRITELINGYIREADILCRWGGDEFIIMLPNTIIDRAYHLAEKLRILISKTEFDDKLKITCSFGVASIQENEAGSNLIARADAALYDAKGNNRNCAVISKSFIESNESMITF